MSDLIDRFFPAVVFLLGLFIGSALQSASAAFPVDASFTWTPPVEREDGSALPQTEIASYSIECEKGGATVFLASVPNDPAVGTNSYFAAGAFDGAGTYSCVARTVDTEGRVSAPSNVATKKVVGNPNAPVNFELDAARQP